MFHRLLGQLSPLRNRFALAATFAQCIVLLASPATAQAQVHFDVTRAIDASS